MAAPDSVIYRVGTLNYTRTALAWLFFWLLLGDFSMSVMGVALPKLLPLHLDTIGMKPAAISWALSLGPLASLALSPFIGVWSDRLRTKWGRRRPFLLLSTPVVALGMVMIPHIKNYALLVTVILVVQIGNVLETVLFYLYADIVPPSLMGRFMAAFRIVGTLGLLTFQYFLLPLFGRSPTLVWTICGVSYFLLYQFSLFFLREGEYPEPPKEVAREIVRDYVSDGLGNRYVWFLWMTLGMVALATPAGYFVDLFSRNNLKLDMTQIGHMSAWATLPTLFLLLPSGWLIDRFGPRLLWGVFSVLSGLVSLLAFFFVHDAFTMQIYYLVASSLGALLGVALMPMLYAHLPKMKFGQLVSTQSLVIQSLIFLSTNCVGYFISSHGDDYRFTFLYSVPFLLMTPLFLLLLRRTPNPFADLEMAMCNKSPTVTAHSP